MGCNCGDNEYEIIVDNNGSCEPTTPEYYITLENVGVDGFSPTINQVNVTSSSFQLQITDVNGTETTGNIPLLSYLNNNFVTNTDLADTLTAYVTNTSLANTLTNYVTNTSLATTLADYVTNSNLTTTLTNYVTNSSLSSTLNNYVTNSSLSSTLSVYALDANVVHKTGTEVISGNKVFSKIYTYRIVGNSNNTSMSIDTYNSNQNLYIGAGEAGFIQIGNYQNNPEIRLIGNTVTLNGENIATVDQIPTVGNGTITITQGGVSKGTFTTNQSGNTTIDLDAGGGGGSSYTAGTGIDITNDTISIDTSVVATKTDITNKLDTTGSNAASNFTVNGTLLDSGGIYKTDTSNGQIYFSQTNSNIHNSLGVDSNRAYLDMSSLTLNSYPYPNARTILNTSYDFKINVYQNKKLYYNNNEVATVNQIPTVNNPTIAFTQGGVTKGTITLNQSSNQTIALDAGGGGGGAVIDDNTPSTTTVYSSQKTQDLIDALLARIAALEANINGGNA